MEISSSEPFDQVVYEEKPRYCGFNPSDFDSLLVYPSYITFQK